MEDTRADFSVPETAQVFFVIDDVFRLKAFAFFHQRADDIGLMAFLNLFTDKAIGGAAVPLVHHAVFDGERSEEHTSELQSRFELVCRLLLEQKKTDRRCARYA